jgi:HK97 gp10 family phage protein
LIQVTGIEAIDRKLKELSKNEVKAVIRKACREGAKTIAALAKELTPAGETGQEKRNIKVRALDRSRKAFGAKVELSSEDLEKWYFSFEQFGHKAGATKVKGSNSMREAFLQLKEQVKNEALEAIKIGIDEKVRSK